MDELKVSDLPYNFGRKPDNDNVIVKIQIRGPTNEAIQKVYSSLESTFEGKVYKNHVDELLTEITVVLEFVIDKLPTASP